MPDLTLFESTYKWNCPACRVEVLAIRHNETTPLTSATCPACQMRILVSPSVRHEQPKKLVAASEIA